MCSYAHSPLSSIDKKDDDLTLVHDIFYKTNGDNTVGELETFSRTEFYDKCHWSSPTTPKNGSTCVNIGIQSAINVEIFKYHVT